MFLDILIVDVIKGTLLFFLILDVVDQGTTLKYFSEFLKNHMMLRPTLISKVTNHLTAQSC
jgi:hypoxanthine-guanine phosphoribosyltransferase